MGYLRTTMFGRRPKPIPSIPRRLLFGQEARQSLVRGALKASRAIAVTYGPLGGLAALDRVQGLLHTKDGATVAQELFLPDPVENLGAQFIRQACLAANAATGDGTTTTAILAQVLIRQAHEALTAGYNPRKLTQGIRAAVDEAIETIQALSVQVDRELLQHVALVASNRDAEVAEAMTEAALAVGKDGTIMIEDGYRVGIELDFQDGMGIESGWAHPDFVTIHDRQECHKGSVLVAVVAVPLTTPMDVASIMEEASTLRPNDDDLPDPLLIMAPRVSGDALVTLCMNNNRFLVMGKHPSVAGKLPVYLAVNAPGTGPRKVDHLGDIAAAAGAKLVDPLAGMNHKQFDRKWFGSFQNISLYRDRSVFTIYDEHQDSVAQRLRVLRAQGHVSTSEYDQDQLKKRRARLSGGVCVLRVSSHNEATLKERRARVEDTLSSIQAALRSGIVPGGGIAYLTASEALSEKPHGDPDVQRGRDIVIRALEGPLRHLAHPTTTVPQVQENRRGDWEGWDVTEGQIRDLRQAPAIIDPTDVVVEALRAAFSVATTFLTTEVSMTQVK